MKITSEICKEALVKHIKENPGCVRSQFMYPNETGDFDETPAQKPSNWKRISKSKGVRVFDCLPFDDQLRAYIYDDGSSITSIQITGE